MRSPSRRAGDATRVLIVVANREQFPEPAFPAGALYVAGAVEAAGGKARVFDAGLHRRPLAALRAELEAWRPDAVGLSLRNVDNAAWPHTRTYADWYARVAEAVRAAAPEARLVLGGPAFSIFPRELRRALLVADGVVGDGEDAARRLVTGDLPTGIVEARLEDLADVRFPADLSGVFGGAARYRTVGVQTARGCRHGCIYCTYPRLEGARLRRRPPEAVVDEMERLRRDFKIVEQFVVDSSFNAAEDHMVDVCEELRRRRELPGAPLADVSFSCYLQPRVSDPAVLGLLAAAGCTSVDFGIDTAAEAMLPRFGKSFTVADLRTATGAAMAAGLDVCHSLLFGGPGETPATVAETVRVTDELAPTAVVAMVGVRIYPGTALARIALEEGVIGEREPLLEPRFYAAGHPAGDEAVAWLPRQVREAAVGRRSWFLPGARDWSAAWGPRVLRRFGKAGPLWRNFPRPRWYRYF
ncbi:MAG: radical SAM protein [Actinobacteria bacterium]|nr:radical SAM protein [Actinomycetota bacterium]